MLLYVNIILVSVYSALILTLVKIKGRVNYLLGFFVIACASIVLIVEFISIFRVLTALAIVSGEIAFLLVAGFLWLRAGKPNPVGALRLNELRGEIHALWDERKGAFPSLLLGLGVLFLFFFISVRIMSIVDADIDADVYHFPRLAFWLQNGSISFIGSDLANVLTDKRIIEFPHALDVFYLWYFIGHQSIRGVQVVEWASLLPSVVAIYGIASHLTANRKAAAFTAFLYPTFEIVHWDAQHAGGMISSTALLLAAVYFLLNMKDTDSPLNVCFFSMSLALAIASKHTVFFTLPVIGIVLILILGKYLIKKQFKTVGMWVVIGLASFILLAGFYFYQSQILYGSPLPVMNDEISTIGRDISFAGCSVTNSLRYAYWSFYSNVLPLEWQSVIYPRYLATWLKIGDLLSIPWSSSYCTRGTDFSPWLLPGYSIIFIPLFIGGSITSFARMIARRDSKRLFIWSVLACFIIFMAGVKLINYNNFRYLAPASALITILFVDFIDLLKGKNIVLYCFAVLSLLNLLLAAEENYTERFGPEGTITIGTPEIIDEVLSGADDVIYAYLKSGISYTMLFGEDLSRTLTYSTCAGLIPNLEQVEHSHIIFSFGYPRASFEECITASHVASGELLWPLLNEEYVLTYETWFTNNNVLMIYEKLSLVSDDELYPLSFPPSNEHIFIDEGLSGLVGAGPVDYIRRGIGLPGEDYMFSLRSAEDRQPVQLTASFSGEACRTEGIIHVRAYDDLSALILEEDFSLSTDDGLSAITFDLVLDAGITRLLFDEGDCDQQVESILTFQSMVVEGLD